MQLEGSGGGSSLVFKEVFATAEAVSPRQGVASSAGPSEHGEEPLPRGSRSSGLGGEPASANLTFLISVLCLGKSIFAGFLRN